MDSFTRCIILLWLSGAGSRRVLVVFAVVVACGSGDIRRRSGSGRSPDPYTPASKFFDNPNPSFTP